MRNVSNSDAGFVWFNSLSGDEQNAVADGLVLGDIDWRDWFDDPPPMGFWREVDEARQLWQQIGE